MKMYAKFGYAAPFRFRVILEKPQGGGGGGKMPPPPPGRWLSTVVMVKDGVECLLTLAIWSYGHEAEGYIFLNLPFPSNPKGNSSICCILSTPEQNLL